MVCLVVEKNGQENEGEKFLLDARSGESDGWLAFFFFCMFGFTF